MDKDKDMHMHMHMGGGHEREPMIADDDMSMATTYKQRLVDEMQQPRKKLRLTACNSAAAGNGWFRARIKHLSTGVAGKIVRS